jgi:hypothetical protein
MEKDVVKKDNTEKPLTEKPLAGERSAKKILTKKQFSKKTLSEERLTEEFSAKKTLTGERLTEEFSTKKMLSERRLTEKPLSKKTSAKKTLTKNIDKKKICLSVITFFLVGIIIYSSGSIFTGYKAPVNLNSDQPDSIVSQDICSESLPESSLENLSESSSESLSEDSKAEGSNISSENSSFSLSSILSSEPANTSPRPTLALELIENYTPSKDAVPTKVITLGDTSKKEIALTFDDRGKDLETIIGILDKKEIKASFFLMAGELTRNPDFWRQAVANGHQVLNHTVNHNVHLYRQKSSYIYKEIMTWESIAAEVL